MTTGTLKKTSNDIWNELLNIAGHFSGTSKTWTAFITRSSAIAKGPRDVQCQLKSCQLPRNSAETTRTTSPEVMKLEG